MALVSDFTVHDLGDGLQFLDGRLPDDLRWDAEAFAVAWDLHPAIRPSILMHGRQVQVPRWTQAYGVDYRYSGQTSMAKPVPPLIDPLLAWARQEVHAALNAVLVNWYEGPGHYIGPHHDTTKWMLPARRSSPCRSARSGCSESVAGRGRGEKRGTLSRRMARCSSYRETPTTCGSTRFRSRPSTPDGESPSPSADSVTCRVGQAALRRADPPSGRGGSARRSAA